jgi:hypothetical protein
MKSNLTLDDVRAAIGVGHEWKVYGALTMTWGRPAEYGNNARTVVTRASRLRSSRDSARTIGDFRPAPPSCQPVNRLFGSKRGPALATASTRRYVGQKVRA